MTDPSTVAPRVAELGRRLVGWEPIWRPRPFATHAVTWEPLLPATARWLMTLDDDALDAIEARDVLPDEAPAEVRALAREVAESVAVPRLAGAPAALDRHQAAHVPGRKRDQIEAFAGVVLGASDHRAPTLAGPVVDWCGGKGHLGRTLGALSGQAVTIVELVAGYADEARDLARKLGVELAFVAEDALSGRADDVVRPDVEAVALHACGALGTRLVELAGERRAAAVTLAPCCLHKGAWRCLSAVGRAADPGLDHSALRLATSDEVVAPPRLRLARRRENAFRQGLDLLLREASGDDVYTPLGTLPHELSRAPFEVFCREAALLRGRALPAFDPARAEAAGWERARRARAFGLVRGLFRRAIELYVALDRAAYLAERGYADVAVGTFCARGTTPRNLLVRARGPA